MTAIPKETRQNAETSQKLEEEGRDGSEDGMVAV